MSEETESVAVYQLKQPERSSVIPEVGDPWADDKLDRKKAAERFARMLAGQVGPLTIGLNGRWGEGKTFFLKRFQKSYESMKGCAIYFNAWQDDFLDDPLLSLLGQLRTSLGRLPQETLSDSVKQAVPSLLKHAGVALFKSFVKNAAKIDIDAVSADELETTTERLLDKYEKVSASRDELVKALESLAKSIHDWSDKPLVIIVDELDRCRPSFAIEMLERIKHLFAVENIVFVLGIDCGQLESSIQSVYGEIDARGYLQRFIDIEIVLPRSSLYGFLKDRLEEPQLVKAIDPAGGKHEIKSFFSAFCAIADAQHLPPRAVEQAIRKFALVACAKDHESHAWMVLTAYAVGLSLHPDKILYNRFLNCTCEPKEVVDAVFSGLSWEDVVSRKPVVDVILYLYTIFYHASGDVEFRNKFTKTLAEAKADTRSDRILTKLPSFTVNANPLEVYKLFQRVPIETHYQVSLKHLLADLREAMSSIVEFTPIQKEP